MRGWGSGPSAARRPARYRAAGSRAWCVRRDLDALERHHLAVAGALAQLEQRAVVLGAVPGLQRRHVRELEQHLAARLQVAFQPRSRTAAGQVAPAEPLDRGRDLGAIGLEA